jgi:hypothetical protein
LVELACEAKGLREGLGWACARAQFVTGISIVRRMRVENSVAAYSKVCRPIGQVLGLRIPLPPHLRESSTQWGSDDTSFDSSVLADALVRRDDGGVSKLDVRDGSLGVDATPGRA